jgi:prolyl-tRNA editing enzyme YbaK/EbsC (Cys-tRNA(Pro) deacylase)
MLAGRAAAAGRDVGVQEYEKKLQGFLQEHNVPAEHLSFNQSCHSVAEAARAAGAAPEDLVKNVCLIDGEGHLIVAIVKGEDRVSTKRVGQALGIDPPRTATPEEILEKTGYPCGGVPSFGFTARFLIDPKVLEKEFVFTGGGSERSLVRLAPQQLPVLNQGLVVRIRK